MIEGVVMMSQIQDKLHHYLGHCFGDSVEYLQLMMTTGFGQDKSGHSLEDCFDVFGYLTLEADLGWDRLGQYYLLRHQPFELAG